MTRDDFSIADISSVQNICEITTSEMTLRIGTATTGTSGQPLIRLKVDDAVFNGVLDKNAHIQLSPAAPAAGGGGGGGFGGAKSVNAPYSFASDAL
ncbi:hypothetical protein D917_02208, partial [Trichinella nativa]